MRLLTGALCNAKALNSHIYKLRIHEKQELSCPSKNNKPMVPAKILSCSGSFLNGSEAPETKLCKNLSILMFQAIYAPYRSILDPDSHK